MAYPIIFTVGIMGNITSVLVYLAPIETFWRVIKKKSTENFKGLPYITALLSTSLWTFYGILKPGGLLVVTVNSIGAFIHVIYVVLYLIYAPKEVKVKSAISTALFDIGFPGVVISVALLAVHEKSRLIFVGVLCAGVTIGRYWLPLSIMRNVVKTKSTEYMPFPLSFFLFINAAIWTTYSVLLKDYCLFVPNSIGFIMGSAQLILYAIYEKKSLRKSSEDQQKDKDDSVQLVIREEVFEMEAKYEDDKSKASMKINPRLTKGRSLPEPSIARQYSFNKIRRTLSLGKNEHYSSWQQKKDVENGGTEH